jgi:hypothetical protein
MPINVEDGWLRRKLRNSSPREPGSKLEQLSTSKNISIEAVSSPSGTNFRIGRVTEFCVTTTSATIGVGEFRGSELSIVTTIRVVAPVGGPVAARASNGIANSKNRAMCVPRHYLFVLVSYPAALTPHRHAAFLSRVS